MKPSILSPEDARSILVLERATVRADDDARQRRRWHERFAQPRRDRPPAWPSATRKRRSRKGSRCISSTTSTTLCESSEWFFISKTTK